MRAPDVAAPPRQPQPHMGLLLPPSPPTGPARRGGCRRRRDSDAGGRWASDSGIEQRDVNLNSLFFSSPSWTHPLPAPPLPVHVTLSSLLFFLHHFSPFRRASFLSPPRFVYLRPAGRPFCCKKTKIIYWIFQKGKPRFREQEAAKQGDLC